MIPTPGEADLRRAAELCEFCPKMCRFACPVSEADPREALTPWGKVSLAALTAGVGRAPDASVALAFHGCTGCLRCQVYCAHGQDVPTLLFAARGVAMRSGVAPAGAQGLPARFADRGHAEEGDRQAQLRELRAQDEARGGAEHEGGPVLFAGCEALAHSPASALDALAAARALGAPLRLAPDAAVCCGLPLLEGGHTEAFAAHALRTRDTLATAAPRRDGKPQPVHLVALSPSCARTLRDRYPGHGAALPAGSVIEHVTTFLARALAVRPDLLARPKLPGPIAWHDPCELARGLGETEAPRALLAAAVEGGAREAVRCGADTACCGAGGLLPLTHPQTARKLAQDRAAELAATGAPAVTASPVCARALGAADLVGLVATWLAER
jgi:Fe-S oxidoreductase